METKTQLPSFNVSLRGYDREEVDEYLDSVADALGHVEDATEHNRRLQAHVNRLNARIKELEDQAKSNVPRTGVVLGERVGLIINEAELTAADIIRKAEERAATADEALRTATARGEDQARQIESSARSEAADIVSEAEARAAARTRQIEQWAEQVVSHTRAEEALMVREQQERQTAAAAELESLAAQRRAAALALSDLRDVLNRALGLVEEPDAGGATSPGGSVSNETTGASDSANSVIGSPLETASGQAGPGFMPPAPGPASAGPAPAAPPADPEDGPRTGEMQLLDRATIQQPEDDFESKLEAWVSEGTTDFKDGL
jgi:DivIVA domain-containing protein